MPSAVLSVTDDSRNQIIDLEITWERGHDIDADVQVPKRYEADWREAARVLKEDAPFRPYPTLTPKVTKKNINSSATGFFAVASMVFDQVAWKTSPPYPEENSVPEGAVS